MPAQCTAVEAQRTTSGSKTAGDRLNLPEHTGIPACDDYLSSYLACHRAAAIYAPDQLQYALRGHAHQPAARFAEPGYPPATGRALQFAGYPAAPGPAWQVVCRRTRPRQPARPDASRRQPLTRPVSSAARSERGQPRLGLVRTNRTSGVPCQAAVSAIVAASGLHQPARSLHTRLQKQRLDLEHPLASMRLGIQPADQPAAMQDRQHEVAVAALSPPAYSTPACSRNRTCACTRARSHTSGSNGDSSAVWVARRRPACALSSNAGVVAVHIARALPALPRRPPAARRWPAAAPAPHRSPSASAGSSRRSSAPGSRPARARCRG